MPPRNCSSAVPNLEPCVGSPPPGPRSGCPFQSTPFRARRAPAYWGIRIEPTVSVGSLNAPNCQVAPERHLSAVDRRCALQPTGGGALGPHVEAVVLQRFLGGVLGGGEQSEEGKRVLSPRQPAIGYGPRPLCLLRRKRLCAAVRGAATD